MANKKQAAEQPPAERVNPLEPGEYDFDKFVAYGIAAGANVVNGMPWSFKFGGIPVTHENDDLYIVGDWRFARGDTLIVGAEKTDGGMDVVSYHAKQVKVGETTAQAGDSPIVAEGMKTLDQAHGEAEKKRYVGLRPEDEFVEVYKDHNNIGIYGDPSGHRYVVGSDDTGSLLGIDFQNGPIKEVGINGVQNEHLLAILIHRTKILNERFPCDENVLAIRHMKAAIKEFQSRTANRVERGVEGENKV